MEIFLQNLTFWVTISQGGSEATVFLDRSLDHARNDERGISKSTKGSQRHGGVCEGGDISMKPWWT